MNHDIEENALRWHKIRLRKGSKLKKKGKKVAVVILSYNCEKYIEICLDSLLCQTYGNFKIVVVDNCSNDKTVDIVRNKYRDVEIIMNDSNYGFGKGFNVGIKHVQDQYQYIALLNPDIRVSKEWLQESVFSLEKNISSQICGAYVLDWEGKTIDNAGGIILNLLFGVFGGFLGGEDVKNVPDRYKNEEFQVFCGIATAIVVKKEAFVKYGLFDESYFMYFEDLDFSWRIILSGNSILCNPRATVYHYGHGTTKSSNIQLKISACPETNVLATYYKNLSTMYLIVLLPILVIMRIIFSFGYIFISPKITYYKIKAIGIFMLKMIEGRYIQGRIFAQKLRVLSDFQVFRRNPTNVFSIAIIFKLSLKWLLRVQKVFKNNRVNGT